MRNFRYILIIVFILLGHISIGQHITTAEYFWDVDPGLGNGIPMIAEDGAFDEAIEKVFDNSSTTPGSGLHTFNIRVKGSDNTWSSVFSHTVNISNNSLITRDMEVVQAEYFWDTDPGIGAATPILALDGNLDEALELLFNNGTASPSSGLHTFNLRVKGFDNTWSTVFTQVVDIYTPTLLSRSIQLVEAEYFWDVDPGQGSGTPIFALDGNLDEAIEALFSNSLSAPAGNHVFYMRVKGEDNSWSNPFGYVVEVISNVTTSTIYPEICAGESYTVPSGHETYAVSGTYLDTLVNTSGFDSIITINLAVNPITYSTISPVTCISYTSPSGNVYNTSGTYIDTIPNTNGCDSIITINLSVESNTYSSITVESCDSYFWPVNNQTYTNSGAYSAVLTNASGCDSTVTLNLTITSVNATISQSDNVLISGSVNGGTYQWINCITGTPIPGETGQQFIATANGDYAVVVSVNNCSDTSVCVTVDNVDVNQHLLNTIHIYPNPTHGSFIVDLGEAKSEVVVTVRDAQGRSLQVDEFRDKKKIQMFLEYPAGTYFIELIVNNEKTILRLVID